jgi:phosphomevalonate kinase
MLAGEYAVLEGHEAIVAAIERRAVASLGDTLWPEGPFLQAVVEELRDSGRSEEILQRALRVRVDTGAFRHGDRKLGLGSSAAATTAAAALALGVGASIEEIHRLAHRAHARAQTSLGAAGSGADVAASAHGGCAAIATAGAQPCTVRPLPCERASQHLALVWTAQAASTPHLVAAVHGFREAERERYDLQIQQIARAAAEFVAALANPSRLVEATYQGAAATRALGEAAAVSLWLPEHQRLSDLAAEHGGALKPTGAGGGDLALAAFADPADCRAFLKKCRQRGIYCLEFAVAREGVRLQNEEGKVSGGV